MTLNRRALQERVLVVGIALAIMVGMVAVGVSADTATPDSRVASPVPSTPIAYPPSEPVFGATYGEWSARYWQWMVSLPIGVNPVHDASGGACGHGQSGPVFFVAPNLPPCAVPASLAVMVHLAGTLCSTLEGGLMHAGERQLRACAAEEADRYGNISVLVDGEPVPDLATYRILSPIFPVIMPEANVRGATSGIGLGASDGYWVILPPMAPGVHEVVVHLELADGLLLPEETLRLSVVDPSHAQPAATPVS